MKLEQMKEKTLAGISIIIVVAAAWALFAFAPGETTTFHITTAEIDEKAWKLDGEMIISYENYKIKLDGECYAYPIERNSRSVSFVCDENNKEREFENEDYKIVYTETGAYFYTNEYESFVVDVSK